MKIDCSKEALEKIVKLSYSISEVVKRLGLSINGKWNRGTVKSYILQYNLDTTHFKSGGAPKGKSINSKFELKDILIENSKYENRTRLKERLYNEGLKERKCELCGQDENWYNKKMSLILDHKNGINNDHRLENLQIVCPNCNATLETHCRGFIKVENIKLKKEIKKETTQLKQKNRALSQRKVKRPTLDILKNEIIHFGYEGVGRKYGVSGTAIRKWIRTYEKYGY